MIKLVMCVTKKETLSKKEFQNYWLNNHGKLLKEYAETYNVLKYTQNHTIDSKLNENVRKSRAMPEIEYDGIAELWWESEEKFIEAISSKDGEKLRTVFLDDEARFLDFSKSTAFFTKEYNIL